jgi:hypothetical protein
MKSTGDEYFSWTLPKIWVEFGAGKVLNCPAGKSSSNHGSPGNTLTGRSG